MRHFVMSVQFIFISKVNLLFQEVWNLFDVGNLKKFG